MRTVNSLYRFASLAVLALIVVSGCAPSTPPPTATPTFFPIIPTPEAPTATPTLIPLLILPTPTQAAVSQPITSNYYRVLSGLNCRNDSNEDADIVTTFSDGTVLEALNRTLDGTWLQVSSMEMDATCWVSSKLVTPTNPLSQPAALAPAAAGELTLFQANNVTNCRQGPDLLYRIDAVLQPGETAQVLGHNQTSEWYLLMMSDQIIRCWVSARMGSVNSPIESIRTMTMFRLDIKGNCRQGPATFYPVETSYIPKRYFIIQGRSADDRWIWIERNRTTWHCWLSNTLGVIDGSLEQIPIMTGIQVRTNANCRQGPGTLYPVVAQVPADTVVAVEGRSPAGQWLYTVMPDGVQRCWISADVGTLPGTLEGIQVTAPPADLSPVITMTSSGQCRTGPSPDYPVRAGFDVDKVLLIIGRNADSSWWQVQNPTTGPDCWVWSALGTVQGSTDAIPVVTVPLP